VRALPRPRPGYRISGSGEAYTTSKIGIKLKTVSGATQGLDFEQDTTAGKTHEHFLRIKLGTGLQFNVTTGAIDATGTASLPATTTTLGTVIVGSGLSVITTAGSTQGTISVNTGAGVQLSSGAVALKIASSTELGGVRINGNGLSIDANGVLTASASLSGGVTNRLAKWTSGSAIGNSNISDDGTTVAVTGAVTVSTTLGVTGATTLSSTLGVSGLSTLTRATVNAVAAAPQTLLVNAGLNASGDGLTITANTRQIADASNSLLLLISRTNQEALKVSITGQLTLGSGILWGTDATFDIGGSGSNRPKDIYATGKLTLGTNPAPGTGSGSASPLRVAGAINNVGTYDAAFFTGAVYASDFVLLDGTGAVAAGGPPIVVVDDANGTLTTTGQPLSQMTFTGAGVTATQTAAGQVTVNIPGGGGGGVVMQSGSSTANALPKFFNSSTTPTLANSRLSDDGTTITLGGTTSVTGSLSLVTGTASVAPLRFTAGTNLTAAVAGAMEWDGTNLYITQTSGPTRKTVAFTDASITGNAANVTGTVAIANGGTGQTSAASAINALLPSQASQNNKVLGTNGTNVSWVTMTSAATISDDTTTDATRYVLLEDVTTGNLTAVNTSSTKLTFNPSTGVLTVSGGLNGNASTASQLATARNINGTSFNGSANITTAWRPLAISTAHPSTAAPI